jgi:hypothetical protein
MFKKFKITASAFIFCIFGLTLTDVTNVSAREGDSAQIQKCAEISTRAFGGMKAKKNCFADVARALNAEKSELKADKELRFDLLLQHQRAPYAEREAGTTEIMQKAYQDCEYDRTHAPRPGRIDSSSTLLGACIEGYLHGWQGAIKP